MKNTYTINLSTIKINNSNIAKRRYIANILNKISYIVIRLLTCAVTISGVFYIFYIFDKNLLIGKDFSYQESITLGALCSALGSPIITITSIFSEHCVRNIDLNIETLQSDQLGRNKKWNRWPFIDRISKHRISRNSNEYYIYSNPSIKFCNLNRKIHIPLSIKDFYELKIFYNYVVLRLNRKNYRKILAFQPNESYLKDILVWDCLMNTYKNVINYKIHKLFSYAGWSIVVSGIIFSFLYPKLITYFDSIILAISTIRS